MRSATSIRILGVLASLTAAESTIQIKYDLFAPFAPYFKSHIVDVSLDGEAWSVYMAPEWIHRNYDKRDVFVDRVVQHVAEEGVGIWFGFGYRPWREDFARAFRTGLYVRARRLDSRVTDYSLYYGKSQATQYRDAITSYGFGTEAAWTLGPFGGSTLFRHALVEPYARLGIRRDNVVTSGDPSTLSIGKVHQQEWNPDIRLGCFGGWSF